MEIQMYKDSTPFQTWQQSIPRWKEQATPSIFLIQYSYHSKNKWQYWSRPQLQVHADFKDVGLVPVNIERMEWFTFHKKNGKAEQ